MKSLIQKAKKIIPIIQYSGEKVLAKYGFDVAALDVDLLADGWIRIHVRWTSAKDKYKFKYVQKAASFFGVEKLLFLEFPEVKYRFYTSSNGIRTRFTANTEIHVGLANNDESELECEPKFHDNIGYGVNVYFAPKGFNNGEGETAIYSSEK